MLRLRQRAAIVLVYMFYAVLLNSVGTVILQSILSFGISKPTGSVLEACKDLSIAVVSFAAASFMPRFGYRRSVVLALILVSLACVAMPLAPGFLTTEVLFLTIGVSFALVKVSVYSLIGLLNPQPKDHAGLTSLVEGCFMVGVLSGVWVFSAFIDAVNPAALSWLGVYWLLAAIGAATALLWATTPMPQSSASDAGQAAGSLITDLRAMPQLWAMPFLGAFLGGVFLYVLVEQSLGTWLPTYNREILRLPVAMSIQTGGFLAAALAVGRLGGAYLLRRFSWLPVLLSCAGGAALVVIAALIFQKTGMRATSGWADAPFQAFILPLAGLFLGPIYPAINSTVLSALPEKRQAPMTGLIIAFSALGGTFGSFLTGQVFSHFGGHYAFALTLAAIALLALSLILFQRRLAASTT